MRKYIICCLLPTFIASWGPFDKTIIPLYLHIPEIPTSFTTRCSVGNIASKDVTNIHLILIHYNSNNVII